MQLILEILRTKRGTKENKIQRIPLDSAWLGVAEERASVATALRYINAHCGTGKDALRDDEGKAISPVAWECNCLQKRCGSCAVVVNGHPSLACDAKLAEVQKKGIIRLEPLKKFPVVEDLVVDRSAMREQLKTLRVWLSGDKSSRTGGHETLSGHGIQAGLQTGPFSSGRKKHEEERQRESVYEGFRCIQCGLCLEVCPNYVAGEKFFGTGAAVPASAVLALSKEKKTIKTPESGIKNGQEKHPDRESDAHENQLPNAYRTHVYEGCGKSLACRNICPAGIDVDRLLAQNAKTAVWGGQKRMEKKERKA